MYNYVVTPNIKALVDIYNKIFKISLYNSI